SRELHGRRARQKQRDRDRVSRSVQSSVIETGKPGQVHLGRMNRSTCPRRSSILEAIPYRWDTVFGAEQISSPHRDEKATVKSTTTALHHRVRSGAARSGGGRVASSPALPADWL